VRTLNVCTLIAALFVSALAPLSAEAQAVEEVYTRDKPVPTGYKSWSLFLDGAESNVMAIRGWHVGKLILLWAWGAALTLLAVVGMQAVPPKDISWALLGWALLLFAAGVPITLSVITWLWLGGREDSEQPR
jgi:hypothetical protein